MYDGIHDRVCFVQLGLNFFGLICFLEGGVFFSPVSTTRYAVTSSIGVTGDEKDKRVRNCLVSPRFYVHDRRPCLFCVTRPRDVEKRLWALLGTVGIHEEFPFYCRDAKAAQPRSLEITESNLG